MRPRRRASIRQCRRGQGAAASGAEPSPPATSPAYFCGTIRVDGDQRAREGCDREGELRRADAGRLHPRPLAAAEQLGQLGRDVRGGRLRRDRPGLARRPGDGRGGARQPRCLRQEDAEDDRRPHRRGDRGARPQASRPRPLDRWPAGPDDRRPRPLGGDGGNRSRPVSRRPTAAALGAEISVAGSRQPAQPGQGDHPDARPVQVRLGQRALRGGGESSSTRPTTWRRPGWR